MKLLNPFTVGLASICHVQVEHRKTAMEYAIAGISLVHEKNSSLFAGDKSATEIEDVIRDWVIETLIQGAYIREYHIWEKDTKKYFSDQLGLNESTQELPKKGG